MNSSVASNRQREVNQIAFLVKVCAALTDIRSQWSLISLGKRDCVGTRSLDDSPWKILFEPTLSCVCCESVSPDSFALTIYCYPFALLIYGCHASIYRCNKIQRALGVAKIIITKKTIFYIRRFVNETLESLTVFN